MLTFQHIGTARHRGDENTMDVMLYGRQADGTSTAVRVVGIEAYGFLKADVSHRERSAINQWVQWLTSMQRSDRGEAKYKKENDAKKPPEDVLNYWQWCFGTAAILESDIRWTAEAGFNIRSVRDVPPPKVWKFSVKRYDIWRALLSIFKDPSGVYDRIRKFRAKMVTCNNDESLSIKGMPPRIHFRRAEIYETMFQPEIVWMVDHQLPACSWMTVSQPRGTICKTSCTVEVECSPDGVQPCSEPPIPMAPFRVSSYDIEACPFVNPETGECEFPEAYRDCITTIGVTSFNMVDAKMKQDVFMFEPEGQPKCLRLSPLAEEKQTDEYDPSETTVHAYTDELEMLRGFSDFIREYDPDIVTGYNVLNFDNVYLLQRIEALCPDHDGDYCSKCSSVRTFSRIDRPSTLRKRYTHTNQRGGQETWEAWIEGRDWMDLYRVVMTDHKLRSYKLDNVCSELLGTKKIHIAYDDIPKHQKTPAGREFLAQYCVKDAWLPCQIMIKRCKLVNAIQMSQVTGVPLTSIIHRGQQIRTLLLMLQFCKARCRKNPGHPRYFLPDESGNKPPPIDGFEGAVVIRPLPGFYQTPVVTLDFASLYPSIMRAYNMCFSTLIPSFREAQRLRLEWSPETHMIKDAKEENYPEVRPVRSFDYPEGGKFEYVSSDDDVCFVTTKKRVGILPEILEQLLSNRKRVKKLRKQFHEKSMDYAVLDGRQLALKVCANSVYGFTGAGMGYLGEKRIASSVTRVGRGMANHTKWMCEDRYKDHGLQIVYGDTDSVFANIPPSMCDTNCSREELITKVDKIGDEMGKFCTKAFLPPNDLEYEKFYYPILLKGKKRYAGHKFEPGLQPKLDVKGFECVRRDFAPIVSKTQKKILVKLCKENDIQGAIDYAREIVVQLLENKVPLEDLTMSKKLTRKPEDYKNPAPHSELAKRLQATQPAHIAPKTGDRIDFVIRPGYKGEKTCMRAVTPDDVRNGEASADTRWYLSNQLEAPLRRIFEMIMDNASSIFEVSSVQQSTTISNPMMRTFVQRSEGHKKRSRSGATVQYKKKKKNKPSRPITSFFN
jgi:DNA polymerase delta subunit 1